MNSFNLYEDILSRTWNRYYYEVEAETLEEAIEKVKDGEVDCYDSEQLYESTDDLAPEENNGSATEKFTTKTRSFGTMQNQLIEVK